MNDYLIDEKELSQYIELAEIQATGISGKILPPLEGNIKKLKEYFLQRGYQPLFEKSANKMYPHRIHLITLPETKSTIQKNWISSNYVNLILFVATVFTTLLIGAINRGGNPFSQIKDFALGIPFSFSLLLILGGHELGHYFTSRHYGVSVTLPYFLPIPHPLVGTMGAFIRIKSMLPNRRALLRIGVAGPIIGFLIALPITLIGIAHSQVIQITKAEYQIRLGAPLLFNIFTFLFHRNIPQGYDLVLSPMAFAGWLGLFVTALNLIPAGQLDGGHIAYAILGRYRKIFTFFLIPTMAGLGILWPGWFFWILLILITGLRHPQTQDEITPLKTSDKILAVVALIIMLCSFTPNPFPIR
ncbi:MAG: site-2 protease family protein [candidate division WOR-3 bacterium]|nr:site-2 protease family protein [candidate division WOR-3 bacterium]